MPALHARQALFDASVYDRLRVLATELARVRDEQGELAVRFGGHVFCGERLMRVMASV
jgi:hypothetical protein